MVQGSSKRTPEYPVDSLFLDRWSPRAMSGEPISTETLLTLLEAARWAPSASNAQPWRFLYAQRDTEHWLVFLGLLVDANRAWAQRAAALVLFVSKTVNDNGQPNPTHALDTGAAWENFALQGALSGLVVHGMRGFDLERTRTELEIPDDYEVGLIAAVGLPGEIALLPEHQQARETPNQRHPLAELACEGPFRL